MFNWCVLLLLGAKMFPRPLTWQLTLEPMFLILTDGGPDPLSRQPYKGTLWSGSMDRKPLALPLPLTSLSLREASPEYFSLWMWGLYCSGYKWQSSTNICYSENLETMSFEGHSYLLVLHSLSLKCKYFSCLPFLFFSLSAPPTGVSSFSYLLSHTHGSVTVKLDIFNSFVAKHSINCLKNVIHIQVIILRILWFQNLRDLHMRGVQELGNCFSFKQHVDIFSK